VSTIAEREIGAARKRVEDPRLLRGRGSYLDDLRLPGTVEVAFVRSAYAHARLRSVNLEPALELPGVVAAWDGQRLAGTPRTPNRVPIPGIKVSPLPPLAFDTVRMVGYPLAIVAAGDRYLARDGADRVEIDYEPLPAVTDVEAALELGAPLLYPEFGSNLAYQMVKEGGDVEAVFARADRRLSLRLAHGRLAQLAMEPRGILASYDRDKDFLTVWRSTQSPFMTRGLLSVALQRPEASIRVIAPDVGGAFGSKSPLYPDELAVVLLALELAVPVRWISTRLEDFQFTMQGREQVDLVEVAYNDDGRILGLKTKTICNLGAVNMSPQAAPPLRVVNYATGAYRIEACRSEILGVFTNTVSTGPYRGAGRPEAAYIAERMIEAVARELGVDSIELRRRNFIQPDQFPWRNAAGAVYDSGDYEMALDRALENVGYRQLRGEIEAERAANADNPRAPLRGIGVSTTIEVSAQGWESGSIEVEPDGTIVCRTGSSSHGQGHETSFAQVVADLLEVPFERIRLIKSDTEQVPVGNGTGGSRSMVLGGGAMAVCSDGIKRRALELGAALLEASPDDLTYERGAVQVAGAPERRLTLEQISQAVRDGRVGPAEADGLEYEQRFDPGRDAVPFGANVAVVSVDRETGRVTLKRFVSVDDCGVAINPLIVFGQVAGGLAQGIGEALYERIAFDESGQLLTASLLDYAMPTAHMLPNYELELTETPSPNNPLGAKGIGESGCVSAPPAVVNAVLDALSPLGIHNLDMPLTSDRVWEALQRAERP
jgi:carbon-monoxide dehydrogenase large subunit